jgi:protein-disulfide isomerase
VLTSHRLSLLVLAATLTTLGCHAQAPATVTTGSPLPPAISHKVEVLLRQKAQLPPASTVNVGPAQPSDVPGYDTVAVTFTSSEGKSSHPVNFLISKDGKTVAQFSKYDISADPRELISAADRPARGGPATAPVLIVGFDDLECPYCARLHETIFPAITQRYGDKVRIVYKDFPLTEIHPWAMRAAVDVNCLGAQSTPGYWNLVDYIHAHASELGSDPNAKPSTPDDKTPKHDAGPDKTLDRADAQLDTITREQGKSQKVDDTKLAACIAKQDTASIEASRQLAVSLNIDSTPALFINGAKIDGAVPIDFIFGVIDDALRAENVVPPPPYVIPVPAPAAAKTPVTPGR